MEFFVNGLKHRLDSYEPGMTLLRYLRTRAGLKGTKEGCASGDCGACTVLVADGQAESAKACSVNSCIAPVGSFAGKSVYTVEGLADSRSPDKTIALHPVQKAMVDCHGSQCGFCTPGFVMSLAGLYQNHISSGAGKGETENIGRNQTLDALSGNLCRCTGYRPILEAAETMLEYDRQPVFRNIDEVQARKAEAFVSVPGESEISGGQYFLPETEAELQSLLAQLPEAFLVAGGTDKCLEITQGYESPQNVIDLTRVAELREISEDANYLYIGGGATYSEVELTLANRSPEFVQLLMRLGSRQIRNRGTIAGNVANGSPIADTPPVLMVWDADIEVVDSSTQRRWVPINEFYLGYRKTVLGSGEYIASIRIPQAELSKPHKLYKISKRFEDDISAVMGAFVLEVHGDRFATVRIAYGGMAAVPIRASKTEALLQNSPITDEGLEQACETLAAEFSPMTDVRASADYRREIAVNLLRKALLELEVQVIA